MIRKYNIVLIPASQNESIVNCSNHFSSISDQYKLGNASLPHVTLCQFQFDENKVNEIWNEICKEIDRYSIKLEFNYFSYITFDSKVFWVSLMPDQRDILKTMHDFIRNKLNININKEYDPHMTLISTKNSFYKRMVDDYKKSYSSISDDFVLAIGECDEIGQFKKLISKCEL